MKKIPTELEGEFIVRLLDLPDHARGFVVYDDDGFANVYINARLMPQGRQKAAEHEIRHILNDDMYSSEDIRTVEARADGRQDAPKPEPPKRKPLQPWQRRVIDRALNDLDRVFRDDGPSLFSRW